MTDKGPKKKIVSLKFGPAVFSL